MFIIKDCTTTNQFKILVIFVMMFQRVMPSYWYVLLRYFLRVDDVLVRSNETRMFHMLNSNYVLREYTAKESQAKDLNVSIIYYLKRHSLIQIY